MLWFHKHLRAISAKYHPAMIQGRKVTNYGLDKILDIIILKGIFLSFRKSLMLDQWYKVMAVEIGSIINGSGTLSNAYYSVIHIQYRSKPIAFIMVLSTNNCTL